MLRMVINLYSTSLSNMQRGLNLYNTNSFRNLRSGSSLGWQATTTVALALTKAVALTTESVLNGAGTLSITSAAPLTTSITFASVDNEVTLTNTKAALYISITLNLLEPSIKDITANKEIIDFIETDERSILQTEVI